MVLSFIGLYAASILQEHNVKFCVLEARNRVGGRTLTKKVIQIFFVYGKYCHAGFFQDDKVGYVDLGGSYVGPTQHYVHKLIRKFNLKTYKVHDEGFSVYLNQVCVLIDNAVNPKCNFKFYFRMKEFYMNLTVFRI